MGTMKKALCCYRENILYLENLPVQTDVPIYAIPEISKYKERNESVTETTLGCCAGSAIAGSSQLRDTILNKMRGLETYQSVLEENVTSRSREQDKAMMKATIETFCQNEKQDQKRKGVLKMEKKRSMNADKLA